MNVKNMIPSLFPHCLVFGPALNTLGWAPLEFWTRSIILHKSNAIRARSVQWYCDVVLDSQN